MRRSESLAYGSLHIESEGSLVCYLDGHRLYGQHQVVYGARV